MSQCRLCGSEVNGAFCTSCGTPAGEPAPWTSQRDPAAVPAVQAPVAQPDPNAGYYAYPAPAQGPAVPQAPPYAQPASPYAQPAPPYAQPASPYAQQAPARSGGVPGLPIVAGVLALAVVAVGILVVPSLLATLSPAGAKATKTTTALSASASVPAQATGATGAGSTGATEPATSAPDPEGVALGSLQTAALGFQPQLSQAVASHAWVAQLSSKYVGISDPLQTTASGSHTFQAVDIVAEYRRLSGRVSDATVILADSRTFGKGLNVNGQAYWRTMALSPAFSSKDVVVAWCARTFPELTGTALTNQCLPQQL